MALTPRQGPLAHLGAFAVVLEVVPIPAAPAVDELEAHALVRVEVPSVEGTPARSHLLLLHAHFCGRKETVKLPFDIANKKKISANFLGERRVGFRQSCLLARYFLRTELLSKLILNREWRGTPLL